MAKVTTKTVSKKTIFGVSMDEDLVAQVRGMAKAREMTYSALVAEAVLKELKAWKAESGKRIKKIPAKVYAQKAA